MNKVWWVVGLVVIAAIIYGVVGSPATPAGPIKIGYVGPLTGDAAAYGQEMKRAVDYRIAQINAAAGENGQTFEVIYEDGKCAGAEAVSAFQKLVDVDGVKVVLGGACSSETLAISPLANEKKVLLLSALSSNPKIEDEGPFTFSLSYSDSMTGQQLAKAVSGYKKIAMITEQNDYNVGVHDVFVASLKQYPNAAIVADETFPKGNVDFRGILEKVKAAGPDAVVLNPNIGATAENLIKQMAALKNWTGYKLFGAIAYLADASRASVGQFAEGMTIIDVPNVTAPEFVSHFKAIETQYGTLNNLGSYYVASTLDAVDLLTSQIVKHGNDPVKIQQDLSTGAFKGFVGDIVFAGNNYFTFSTPGVYMVTEGKAVLR